MCERYITESEFRHYIQKIIGMIENEASKKDVLDYLNSLIQDRMTVLNQIKQVLDEYGFENEIRYDRKDGLYINISDVRHVRLRAQFWNGENDHEVNLWTGKEMGYWYNQSVDSKYRVPWEGMSDKETKLSFPDVATAIEYIKTVAEKYGRL